MRVGANHANAARKDRPVGSAETGWEPGVGGGVDPTPMNLPENTIVAIATPLGESGLAVLRLTGPEALAIADRCFRPAGRPGTPLSIAPSHTVHYGHVVRNDRVIDEVLVSVLRGPRTYTREDTVELGCHGGVLAARTVLAALLASGARLAEPGEFTRRAFLNGRLDLTQAEAVADVIHARTELALAAASEQLAGGLSRRIAQLRERLMFVLAHVEAHLDFPEEDIAPETGAELAGRLEESLGYMDSLLQTATEGRILRGGIRAAIIGRPNVGKSSLLNQLLGQDRAIVSSLPGTTRDTIEETANIRGVPVVFIDTAGLREATDALEQEGIRRSHQSIRRADLILQVLDGSEPLTEEDRRDLDRFGALKRILVRNKIDLEPRLILPDECTVPVVEVCSLTGQGIETLKDTIQGLIWEGRIGGEMLEVMINARHQDALERARAATDRTLAALREQRTLDLVSVDLRIAVQAVGEIVGQTTTEDLLDSIFSRFCIGK
jgi:tRNA modification GTPase